MNACLRIAIVLLLALLAVAPADAAGKRKQGKLLELAQAEYGSAIRWGEFEQAWGMVDPAYRAQHPMTDLDFERYKQVQISSYREQGGGGDADGNVVREVEMGVVNRHTMAERMLRYRERWRWDAQAGRWWLVVGLPDLWNGE